MAGAASGATILISGATSGIGRATTLGLAARDLDLVLLRETAPAARRSPHSLAQQVRRARRSSTAT